MLFHSTRNKEQRFTIHEAILKGIAPDGGLFVPYEFPKPLSINELKILYQKYFEHDYNLVDFAYEILKPFFKDEHHLLDICRKTFSFPMGMSQLSQTSVLLELFHGPTLAFKDFGAQFLAQYLEKSSHEKFGILVATSGDTGGAVASAFYQKEKAHVFILFPKEGVSKIQKQQLTCWDKNISSIAIEGTFDDCQRIVKETFSHMEKIEDFYLSSANSINIGRLLPQMIYTFFASIITFFEDFGEFPLVIIPSGNLGNALSALWAQKLGAPIQKIIFACNENDTLYKYYQTKEWSPQKSTKTLANAMDVGNPSNMERILDLYSYEELMEKTACYCVPNEQITNTIRKTFNNYAQGICPHTACAEYVRQTYYPEENVIVYGTAHPCKFPEVCTENLIDVPMDIPHQLEELLNKPSSFDTLLPDSNLLIEYIKKKIS